MLFSASPLRHALRAFLVATSIANDRSGIVTGLGGRWKSEIEDSQSVELAQRPRGYLVAEQELYGRKDEQGPDRRATGAEANPPCRLINGCEQGVKSKSVEITDGRKIDDKVQFDTGLTRQRRGQCRDIGKIERRLDNLDDPGPAARRHGQAWRRLR